MFSFQLGLPSMARLQSLQGSFPRNIHDDQDFNEDCIAIPPALPDSELTQVSYLISKTKLVFAFARALDEINRQDAMRWERVLEIERELRHIYDSIPEYWKLGQLSSSDSLHIVSARFTLCSIHHKALCVLHSRFLDCKSVDDRFAYSRRVCLSSAMSILRFQAIQNQKIPIDDHLRSLTNYQTSLTIHDYLLAAAIITADLFSGRGSQQLTQGVPTRSDMIKALELSARIFAQMRDQSLEAFKAADILNMLVRKFQAEHQTESSKDTHGTRNGQNAIIASYSLGMRRELGALPTPRSNKESEQNNVQDRYSQRMACASHTPALIAEPLSESSILDTRTDSEPGDFWTRNVTLPQLLPNLDWMEPELPSVSCTSWAHGKLYTDISIQVYIRRQLWAIYESYNCLLVLRLE